MKNKITDINARRAQKMCKDILDRDAMGELFYVPPDDVVDEEIFYPRPPIEYGPQWDAIIGWSSAFISGLLVWWGMYKLLAWLWGGN